MKIRVGIVGATGYGGLELARLLLAHPGVELSAVSSVSYTGQPLSGVYPSLAGFCDLLCVDRDGVLESSEVVFAALPHGLSQELAAECRRRDLVFIDLGADFRLSSEEAYSTWYGGSFEDKELHREAVYGLPELNRESIKKSRLIANPGCYPTSAALGLAPALAAGAIDSEGIIIDSKSGATGAGRALSLGTHFTECNESFSAYKITSHRHIPEIEQVLSELAKTDVSVTFTPHLLPINRGILSTIYARLLPETDFENLAEIYRDFYKDEKFVRISPSGETASIKHVKYSNFCDISLHYEKRTKTLIIISAIDNMVKGAAGQAIQNMNIVFGLEEDAGLTAAPPSF